MSITYREGQPPIEHEGEAPPVTVVVPAKARKAAKPTKAVKTAVKAMRARVAAKPKAPRLGKRVLGKKRTAGKHKR